MNNIPYLKSIIQPLGDVFTEPSRLLFENIFVGWLLCPCRRYVTSIFHFGDPDREHAHDSYHRFFRAGAWTLASIFQVLAKMLVKLQGDSDVVWLQGDDTVHKKTGRKINGAKSCRDAVRSTSAKIAYAWGLQIVLLCLEIIPPWGGEPLSLPINIRLYRKRVNKDTDPSLLDLMMNMAEEVKDWYPEKKIYLVVDGFYASLAGRKAMPIVSRIRSDAALYKMPPKREIGQRGRPRIRGQRLDTPEEIAKKAKDWKEVSTFERGKEKKRLVIVRHVVWHKVLPGKYIRLVVSRDPEGLEKDDFFFSTDLFLPAGMTISRYSDRWAIEDTFRNVKQFLGIEQPQSWKSEGPEKVAAIGYAIYSIIWFWFVKNGKYYEFPDRPWYATKKRPSFPDAIAAIRRQIWLKRFSATMKKDPEFNKITEFIIESIARAA